MVLRPIYPLHLWMHPGTFSLMKSLNRFVYLLINLNLTCVFFNSMLCVPKFWMAICRNTNASVSQFNFSWRCCEEIDRIRCNNSKFSLYNFFPFYLKYKTHDGTLQRDTSTYVLFYFKKHSFYFFVFVLVSF